MFEIFQTLGIIASVLGSAYYIHKDIKIDRKTFDDDLKAQTSRIDAANARSDFLSNQIIDLIREIRK